LIASANSNLRTGVLARIVDSWLINAGERGYEAAFAQMLASEGYRILHAAVHHPFEHGKDIVAATPEGHLHAFQLKGGDVSLGDLDDIQGQLLTLATTAIRYPGVEPPRLPDRAFLVTSGRLSPPARDRIAARNDGVRAAGGVPIEVIERDQLVGRFVAAHTAYLPEGLEELSHLLQFVLQDGGGPLPVRRFFDLLHGILSSKPIRTPLHASRAIGAATVFASYAIGPWERQSNHLAVAEGWFSLACTILWLAEERSLDEAAWLTSYELARDSGRRALRLMLDEAVAAPDLVVPDVVDGMVYPARACVVFGYAAAMLLSEPLINDAPAIVEPIRALLMRELKYIRAHGEASAPFILMIATALDRLGEPAESLTLATKWAKDLAARNMSGSDSAIADPYHSIGDLLLHQMGVETEVAEEDFEGQAYTLHVFIEWLARRDARPIVARLWPNVTRLHFCEFRPSRPHHLLAHSDPEGEMHTWAPATPQSWSALRAQSGTMAEAELPSRLWQKLEMLPYLPLLMPYRLTASVARALDYLAVSRCQVGLTDEPTNDGAEHNNA
jgi:hypothetical protein